VLDTGFDRRLIGTGIPEANLGRWRPPSGGAVMLDGINLATLEGGATPPAGLRNRLHGSEVGAAVLGGPFLRDHRQHLGQIKIAFASIAKEESDTPFLSAAAIRNAFRYAGPNDIKFINASVSAIDERETFRTELDQSNGSVLFIAAAGNDGGRFTATDQT
jgi:hypothetical protein